METTVVAVVALDAPVDRVFALHADVRNLPRVTPGPVRVISASVPTREGDVQLVEIGPPGLTLRWRARITRFHPPTLIVDVQERGPFAHWRHAHLICDVEGKTLLVDVVRFRTADGKLGRAVDALIVAPALRILLMLRHRRTRRLLQRKVSGR